MELAEDDPVAREDRLLHEIAYNRSLRRRPAEKVGGADGRTHRQERG